MAPQIAMIRRRLKRSATRPVTSTSSRAGRKSVSPTSPRYSAFLVSRYICRPTATDMICAAKLVSKIASQKNR